MKTSTRAKKRKPVKKGAKKVPEAFDPAKPLKNPRWESFAQAVFAGDTQAAAYRKSFVCRNIQDKTIHEKASRLASKVRTRIKYLQSQVASTAILTKTQLAEKLSSMFVVTIADFISVDQDGELFVQVTKESMACMSLRKIKAKKIVDDGGNTVMGIHLYEIELESKVPIAAALAKLMGYDKADETAGEAVANEKTWLDNLLAIGSHKTLPIKRHDV